MKYIALFDVFSSLFPALCVIVASSFIYLPYVDLYNVKFLIEVYR